MHFFAFFVFTFFLSVESHYGIYLTFIGANHSDFIKMSFGDDFKSLKGTRFYNDLKPTVMYIHGWQGKYDGHATKAILGAYLKRGDYNVIFNDWTIIAKELNYARTSSKIHDCAEQMADVMVEMHEAGYALNKFHLLGYSFGAHFAGQIGEHLKDHHNILLKRITGFDPAGPLYQQSEKEFNSDYTREHKSIFGIAPLQRGQAKFVDIIHSDAGFLGTYQPTGDVDFWPNGGRRPQPGCDFRTCQKTLTDPCKFCDHDRSWKFFIETVKHPREASFKARFCRPHVRVFNEETCDGPETAVMGFFADLTQNRFHGNYYVETNEVEPFSKS